MLKYKNEFLIEGVIPPSDCEAPYLPIWIKNSTGSFYIGDGDKHLIESFILGRHKCKIDFESFENYYKKVCKILKKFKVFFKGPITTIDKSYMKLRDLSDENRYFYISYNHDDRYLKTTKNDYGVRTYKNALVTHVTFVKIKKDKQGNYTAYTYLNKNWRSDFMSSYSKLEINALVDMFNNYINENSDVNKTNEDMARLFGIKYEPLIKSNRLDAREIVEKSNYNSLDMLNSLKNGMTLSNDILWDFDDAEESTSFNVYGMHITEQNSTLSEENAHVCIGWSGLGDLSTINTKQELDNLYKLKKPSDSNYTKGANVSQIWMFKDTMKIGDYVVYFDGNTAHFGKVIGDYEYIEDMPNQSSDYVNNRKVEWINHIAYNDLPSEYRNLYTYRSIFKLDTYKPLIEDILKGKEIVKDEFDDVVDEDSQTDDFKEPYIFKTNKDIQGENLIVYGTPGCGKSFYVEHDKIGKNKETGEYVGNFEKENIIRTTFFQDYTNTDFVGQILPVVAHNNETNKDDVTYKFNPGPFTLALNLAIQNPNKRIALVIEELNRGNAASIFGDIFQLLDRKDGVSIYNITNVNIQKYLSDENKMYKFDNIKIPSNMFIFATMNTSDQNVFTLDTAFKRRWNFEKIKNTFLTNHPYKGYYIPVMDITWEEFCNSINNAIVNSEDFLNSEDKQLGVFFVDKKCLREKASDVSNTEKRKEFAYKVFEYLWDDVAKYDHTMLFNANFKTLDDLIDKYVEYENEENQETGEVEEKMNPDKIFKNGIFKL